MIRLLEKQNSRNIYEKSFNEDSKVYVDYYYNHRINDNEVVVYEKDGKIVSAMHLIPKNIIFGGKKSEAKYIYAVSTLEEYRKTKEKEAEAQVKASLVLEEIIKKEGIKVLQKDIKAKIAEIAEKTKRNVTDVEQEMKNNETYLKNTIYSEKVINRLKELNNIK